MQIRRRKKNETSSGGPPTVHWMKDNFVRFFFFRTKFKGVCFDKLEVFRQDLGKNSHPESRILKKMVIEGKHQPKITKIMHFGKSEVFTTK